MEQRENTLKPFSFPIKTETFACLDSTNTYALAHCREEEWLLVVSETQTGGKGRLGRSFYSPPGCGIYMSLAFYPQKSMKDLATLTTMSACSVMQAIQKVCGIQTAIKWVNDLYYKGKKVCGILVQNRQEEQKNALVIGIGINFLVPKGGFPKELSQKAGSLYEEEPPITRMQLIHTITEELHALYMDLPDHSFMETYRKACFVTGKNIFVHRLSTGQVQSAFAKEVLDDGSLLVQYENGEKEALFFGEISIRSE